MFTFLKTFFGRGHRAIDELSRRNAELIDVQRACWEETELALLPWREFLAKRDEISKVIDGASN